MKPADQRAAFTELHREMAKGPMEDEITLAEHNRLMHPGMFEGLSKGETLEEARFVVRYWCNGMSVAPIPWRWESEAESWFQIGEVWGEKRQAEKLRNMIEASKDDPDYWDALNWLVVLLRVRERPLPEELEDWTIELHKAQIRDLRKTYKRLEEPPRPPSNEGNPRYAMDNRNSTFASAFGVLEALGLESESVRRRAIAEVYDVSVRTVKDAIEAGMKQESRLPKPWECWPLRT